jgi:hypothetical protein
VLGFRRPGRGSGAAVSFRLAGQDELVAGRWNQTGQEDRSRKER